MERSATHPRHFPSQVPLPLGSHHDEDLSFSKERKYVMLQGMQQNSFATAKDYLDLPQVYFVTVSSRHITQIQAQS